MNPFQDMQVAALKQRLDTLTKDHSINSVFHQQIVQRMLKEYRQNLNSPSQWKLMESALSDASIDALVPILVQQTVPFFKQKQLPIYEQRTKYNICETKQILFQNGKPLPQTDVQQLAKFCEGILQEHPSLMVFTPFDEGIFGINPAMDLYYKQMYHSDRYVGYQVYLLLCMQTKGKRHAYVYRFGCQVKFKIPTDIHDDTEFTIKKIVMDTEFYKNIIPQQLGWNDMDKDIFTQTLNPCTEKEMEMYIQLFCTHIMMVNAFLYQQKKQHPRKVFQTQGNTKPIPIYLPKEVTPTKKKIVMDIHTNQDFNMLQACKQATLDRQRKTPEEIHYQTPSWQVRGYVRHYKNGKSVFIQPSVRKRKEIADLQDTKPAARHITFEHTKQKKGNNQ